MFCANTKHATPATRSGRLLTIVGSVILIVLGVGVMIVVKLTPSGPFSDPELGVCGLDSLLIGCVTLWWELSRRNVDEAPAHAAIDQDLTDPHSR